MNTSMTSDLASAGCRNSAEPACSQDDNPSSSLSFVRLDHVHLHEEYRPSREHDLCRRMQTNGYLANPIIVSQVAGRTFALDGHHRRECLRKLNCSHALVQHVPLISGSRIAFDTWMHLAQVELPNEMLTELASSRLQLRETTPAAADEIVAKKQAVCWLGLYDQPVCRAITVRAAKQGPVDALRRITNMYQPLRVTLHDLPSTPECLELIFKAFRNMNLFVRFARIDTVDVARMVQADKRIPCGITRSVLPSGRVLGVNVPLGLLQPRSTHAERAAWLSKFRHSKPVYYAGPTIVNEQPSPRRYDDPLFVYDAKVKPTSV